MKAAHLKAVECALNFVPSRAEDVLIIVLYVEEVVVIDGWTVIPGHRREFSSLVVALNMETSLLHSLSEGQQKREEKL